MAIAKKPPNTIYLGGGDGPGGESGMTMVNDLVAGVTAKPGMLAQLYDDSGVGKWRPHNAAAGTFAQKAFFIEQIEMNLGVDDDYAPGDLAKVGFMRKGCLVWALIPSGQNIAIGDPLESNGDGYLKEGTTYPIARAYESTGGAVTAVTRLRVEVI